MLVVVYGWNNITLSRWEISTICLKESKANLANDSSSTKNRGWNIKEIEEKRQK